MLQGMQSASGCLNSAAASKCSSPSAQLPGLLARNAAGIRPPSSPLAPPQHQLNSSSPAGVYAALDDGLSALEDDVRACCDLYRNAAKRAGSTYAKELGDVRPDAYLAA